MRLALESLQSSRSAEVEGIPSSLIRFYEQYIALIASESPVAASIAKKTLYWLLFAAEPLSASDVARAISLGMNEADETGVRPIDGAKLAHCCQGLIDFCEEDDSLQLVHQSAKDFLCQKLDSNMAHTYLSKVCLLALTTFEYQADQPASNSTDSVAAARENGLLSYARRNCQRHALQAVSTDQRIGPFMHADDVGFMELKGPCQKRLKY